MKAPQKLHTLQALHNATNETAAVTEFESESGSKFGAAIKSQSNLVHRLAGGKYRIRKRGCLVILQPQPIHFCHVTAEAMELQISPPSCLFPMKPANPELR